MFISCNKANQNHIRTENIISQSDSAVVSDNSESIKFLKEFYTKFYGDYKIKKDIENYVSSRILNRINSLIVKLEMLQNDSVGDRVVGADFNLYFEDTNGKVISNKINYQAHSQEKESRERITPFTFHLENRKYDSKEVYYFVVQDNDTKIENRLNVQIDIAFANDFDW